jgi:hypothetical protein
VVKHTEVLTLLSFWQRRNAAVQSFPSEAFTKEREMAGKNTAVFGIYANRSSIEEAVENLRSAGFRNTDISVLFPENEGTKDLATDKRTKAPEGATTGGVAGGIAGGVLGWLTGIGLIAIPGLGPFLAAGPIVAALAGVGAGGALGGIIGTLAGLGVPEYEAKRFEGRIRAGGILLSVHCDNADWVKRAKAIMQNTGGQDIAAAGEKRGAFANADKPMPRVPAPPKLSTRVRKASGGAPVADEELYADDAAKHRDAGDDDDAL